MDKSLPSAGTSSNSVNLKSVLRGVVPGLVDRMVDILLPAEADAAARKWTMVEDALSTIVATVESFPASMGRRVRSSVSRHSQDRRRSACAGGR